MVGGTLRFCFRSLSSEGVQQCRGGAWGRGGVNTGNTIPAKNCPLQLTLWTTWQGGTMAPFFRCDELRPGDHLL